MTRNLDMLRIPEEQIDTVFAPYAELVSEESQVPSRVEIDDTLRVKVLDRCGMTCNFCHNEGTPVMSNIGFQALRVSIYADTNGIPFIPADINSSDAASFGRALDDLKTADIAREVHWTGGEPTLSKHLPELTAVAAESGYAVKMTSNGQSGARQLTELRDAGLMGVNFSVFGTTPAELAATQGPVFGNDLLLAESRLKKMNEAMAAACGLGLEVKANIVITGENDIDRGLRLLDEAPETVKVRYQADTSNRTASLAAIYKLMTELEAHPIKRTLVAGSSIDNFDYALPDGRPITFKQTRMSRLSAICRDCPIDKAGECYEGFYGVRMYKDEAGTYWLSPCIQQMGSSQPIDTFLGRGGLGAVIKSFRQSDFQQLSAI